MEKEDPADAIKLPVVYTSMDDAPVLFANNLVIQFDQDEFILTLGQVQPPILLGTAEERREAANRLTHVPVRVLIRVGLTRERVGDFARVLTEHIQRYDAQKESKV